MKLTSGAATIPLEFWQFARPFAFAGLGWSKAASRAESILHKHHGQAVTSSECRRIIIADLMASGEGVAARRVSRLMEYRDAVSEGRLSAPCVIILGGTSGSGKDSVAADLQYLIGIDRIVAVDSVRDGVRRALVEEYGSIDLVPPEHAVIFGPTYAGPIDQVVENFRRQRAMVREGVRKRVSYIEKVEYPSFHQPFLIIQGVHASPALLEKQPNRLPLILALPEETLAERSRFRFEEEQGPQTECNRKERAQSIQGITEIQRYLIGRARELEVGVVMEEAGRDQKVTQVAELLTTHLERFMRASGVECEEL